MSEPDPRDQRLAQDAQDVMNTQLQQNDRTTAQSQAVVRQSQHVTEAARDLSAPSSLIASGIYLPGERLPNLNDAANS